jgi:class 3 adenylate cyclase/tetratricopeptide (TPR) repeat protein
MEETERRQLTVLFCDLVGYTPLASSMDPEDLHDLMLAYQRFCAPCIEDAGGFIARFAGDGVLAYFGYPTALEDAPQRAIHAALNLREAGQHVSKPNGEPLAVRIGIATGLVVTGELIGKFAAEERAAAGEALNLAARLQAAAEPNTIVVAEKTKRLAEGVFAFRALPPVLLKGFSSPISAWELLGRDVRVNRFDGRRPAGLSPLVGREIELNEILKAWRDARSGRRRVIGIIGDAGIGKSRLLEEAKRHILQDAPVNWLEAGGVSIFDNTPFHVVRQLVAQFSDAGIAQESQPGALRANGDFKMESVETILVLLSSSSKSGATGSDESATKRRTRLMELLRQWIRTAAKKAPTVIVVEDLHWVDPSTLEFLDLVVGDEAEKPLLFLYTSRAFTHRWPIDARHRVHVLGALDNESSAALAQAAAGNRFNLGQLKTIVSQAGGVPLYVEELARHVADQDQAASEGAIPSTLADLLSARLEELGPARRYAQVAAVLGQEFTSGLFGAMVESEGIDAATALTELQAASIIVPIKAEVYSFRHALIGAAAYGALLKRKRRELHRRAANLIIERYSALAEAEPQALARHWSQAGDNDKALLTWESAGNAANDRRSFREAEHAYREALLALKGVDALPHRDEIELRISSKLSRVLQVTQGYSSSEAARTSQRVLELAAKVGNVEALSREELARWRSVVVAGDYAQAESIVARVMSLTAAQGNPVWRRALFLRAGIQLGFYTGDLARGERAFVEWDVIQDGTHRGWGDDVLSMGIAALIAQMTARQALALERIGRAFAIAERHGNAYDLAMALHCESCLHHFSREPERQAAAATRLAEVAGNSGFEYAGYLAQGWLGIGTANSGNPVKAIEQITEAIAGFERLGARVSMVFWLSALGRARQLAGDHARAVQAYSDAIAFNPQERAFRIEPLLGRAGQMAALARFEEADSDLGAAVRLAAEMGARSFQLRSMIELARLQIHRGDRVEVTRTLQSIKDLLNPEYCAADLADADALSREAGVALS